MSALNTKWKAVSSVMLLITAVCVVFGLLVIREHDAKIAELISGKKESAALLADTLLAGITQKYRKRIVAFTDPTASKSRGEMIQAFADRDREKLLEYSSKLWKILNKENSYFRSIGWVLPDYEVFLRSHDPERFGDNVVFRKDIVAINNARTKETLSGFYFGKKNMQYRIVRPVFLNGAYLGVVQFGINNTLVVEALQKKLHGIAGMALLNSRNASVKDDKAKYTIHCQDGGVFAELLDTIDWSLGQQYLRTGEKSYVLLNVLPLISFNGENLGHFFVVLDISSEVSQKRDLLLTVFALGSAVLFISFIILYLSFGALIQKIIDLNTTLETNNLELEDRVHERTIKLQESEQRLQNILDKAPLGILIADAESKKFQYANPAICKMLGYAKEELEQLAVQDIHPPEKLTLILEKFEEQQQGDRVITPDLPFVGKDGSVFEVDVISSSLMLDGQESAIDFVVDRTQFKKLVKQLHRAQKMEAIGLMAGGVAHDLNNILSGVVSYPELLLLKLPLDSDLRAPLLAIQNSGKRAAAVVADMLTVARGVATTREPHDINQLIRAYLESPECKKIQSRFPRLVCEDRLLAEDAMISCSPLHIQKSIMNLLINAAEAIGEVGCVSIFTANRQVDTLQSEKQQIPPGYYLVVSVEDDGPGIEDADIEHIFEPFYTKKKMGRSGTGLGLSVVWNTVQDHEGVVLVENREHGTRFQLYFPVSTESVTRLPEDVDADVPLGHGETILVVDDEPQLRDIATQILVSLDYAVDSVCSGELALKFLKSNNVDLIVLDMMMDPGMNGRQAYEKIIAENAEQKAIIASGFSESDDVKAVLKMGARGFIKKPYSIEQLGQAVNEALTGVHGDSVKE